LKENVSKNDDTELSFDIKGIQECQCNRHPLLFIDKVDQVVPGKSARGKKSFTFNEWFFPAHFEDDPSVPGFIQVESLVQTFIMTFLCIDENRGKKTSFVRMDNVSYRRKIIPGDTLVINATLKRFKRGIATGSAVSYVDGDIACSADFIIAVPDILDLYKPSS
jgi:3-hydroxyacyl-[acyl-carrier-protein] dehydratase